VQAATLWAVQNNFFDNVPVDKIKDFQTKLVEFLTTRQEAILQQLRDKGAFDDNITAQLKSVVGQFAETYA
jgi:F-type H+-transporting ATPase subunit alpha